MSLSVFLCEIEPLFVCVRDGWVGKQLEVQEWKVYIKKIGMTQEQDSDCWKCKQIVIRNTNRPKENKYRSTYV